MSHSAVQRLPATSFVFISKKSTRKGINYSEIVIYELEFATADNPSTTEGAQLVWNWNSLLSQMISKFMNLRRLLASYLFNRFAYTQLPAAYADYNGSSPRETARWIGMHISKFSFLPGFPFIWATLSTPEEMFAAFM